MDTADQDEPSPGPKSTYHYRLFMRFGPDMYRRSGRAVPGRSLPFGYPGREGIEATGNKDGGDGGTRVVVLVLVRVLVGRDAGGDAGRCSWWVGRRDVPVLIMASSCSSIASYAT